MTASVIHQLYGLIGALVEHNPPRSPPPPPSELCLQMGKQVIVWHGQLLLSSRIFCILPLCTNYLKAWGCGCRTFCVTSCRTSAWENGFHSLPWVPFAVVKNDMWYVMSVWGHTRSVLFCWKSLSIRVTFPGNVMSEWVWMSWRWKKFVRLQFGKMTVKEV